MSPPTPRFYGVCLQDGGEGADTAADMSTTDSESVSEMQLVRGGGEQRTLFKLTLQVRALSYWHVAVSL